MMKTVILAILEVLVSLGKKPSDTVIVGIAAIPKTIPKTIPTIIRNEKNEKNGIAIPKTIPRGTEVCPRGQESYCRYCT